MSTFSSPTLHQAVLLSELYDGQKHQFLGVQLYTQDTIGKATITTPTPYSDLNLSMSTSFQDKANIIDIKAEISLEVLGGLVSVKGSAAYVNDAASNTTHRSWAMIFKQLDRAERLEVGNSDLSVNSSVLNEYTNATHFISAIQYGGNMIVRMTEQTSKLTKAEKVEGALEVRLEKLKGAIDANASASAEIKSEFADLNDKFDIVMYGDFTINKTPVNAQDVLDVIPEAVKSLSDQSVGLTVTLSPIPPSLRAQNETLYNLDQVIVNSLLDAYAKLSDINGRFNVLLADTGRASDLVPDLYDAVVDAFDTFDSSMIDLTSSLKTFLETFYQNGTTDDLNSLLQTANDLIAEHGYQPSDGQYVPPDYPASLGGLEKAWRDFSILSEAVEGKNAFLSSLDTVAAKAKAGTSLALFLSWSVSAISVIKFSMLIAGSVVRKNVTPYYLYVADTDDLSESLPGGDEILLDDPDKIGLFLYTISGSSISWDEVASTQMVNPPVEQYYPFDFVCTSITSITKDTTLHLQPMFKLDENFTIIFKHTMSGNYTPMLLACVGFDKSPVDTFKNPSSANPQFFITATSSGIDIVVYNGTDYSSVLPYSLAVSNPNSQIALVQDVANKTWTTFVSNWSDDGITTSTASVVQSIPSDFKWWGSWTDTIIAGSPPYKCARACHYQGTVISMRVYPGVLTQSAIEQISTLPN